MDSERGIYQLSLQVGSRPDTSLLAVKSSFFSANVQQEVALNSNCHLLHCVPAKCPTGGCSDCLNEHFCRWDTTEQRMGKNGCCDD